MICRPHEGPEEYEFDLFGVTFSDGVERFICKSDIVPEDYIPRVVYKLNKMMGSYYEVGSFIKEYGGYGVEGSKYVFMPMD